uniref:ABC transporter domain-containing protein n=1 Tax=viral metagenome TaxID=1070528 RepID=A0A6C0KHR7_9ZZZZ
MNIVSFLLKQFFQEEQLNTFFMVLASFVINLFQTNGISFITATIIDSIQKKQYDNVHQFFKYFIVVSMLFVFLFYLYKFFQNKLLTKLRQWMRHQLVKMLLLVNNENFSEINFSKLNSPINRISSVCFMVFNDIITYLLPNITFLLMISIYFLYNNVIFGSIFIIGNILLVLYLFLNWNNMLSHNEEYEKFVSDNEAYLVEILNNIDKIIYRGQTTNEIDIFSGKTDKSIDTAFKFYSNTNYHATIMNAMVFIIIILCLWYLIQLTISKQMTITTFITFFTILLLYREKSLTMIQQIPDFIEFLGRSDSVVKHFQNMAEDYTQFMKTNYIEKPLQFNKIRFENVDFKYKQGFSYVLKKFNKTLDLNDKIIGIVGLSGNGKSTIAKLIIKMYKAESGAIYIDDENIMNIDGNYIRNHITYVNQNSKLFDRKIIENLLYGCYDLDICNKYLHIIMKYPKIKELYKNVDIHNKKAGLFGENLSGGQRQVVNLIGGLVMPSQIVILDEPTNALDMALKKEVIQLIADFKKYKKCIMIITHDKDLFPIFNETIKVG